MAWFISDNHFNHENIIKYCDRPFKTKEEMDEYMIEKWNSVVKEGDTVYHLGDFALGLSFEDYLKLVSQLQGNITLIYGNHDRKGVAFMKRVGFKDAHKKRLVIGKYILTHRPQDENQIPDGFINLHGHIHGNNYREDIVDKGKYRNLSVEVLDYTPVWIDLEGEDE